jgi:hypothetical protein
MGKAFKIPWIGGQNTMDKGFDISWVGGSVYHMKGGQVRMERGFNISWTVDLYTMGRGSKYHG